jgi:hypothetical protein
MANNEHDLEDVANLDEAKKKAWEGKHEEEEEEKEDEDSSKKSVKGKKKKEEEEEECGKKMDEETLAASSLHPAARSVADDKALAASKIGMMQHMMGVMGAMSKQDLTHWFNATMAQFGPGKDWGVGDNSAHNQATIDSKLGAGPKTAYPMPHLSVKEDVEAMFDGQDLSEETKEKVSTLFEAAVAARIIAEQTRLEEEFEAKLAEEVATIGEELTSKLNTYLDYVVENWMTENEVAIESTLRNELAEEFIEGLKNLFAEHYINVPEDKVDVLEAMADKVAALETKLDESISENAELKGFILEAKANEIFEEVSSDLALTQKDKFSALAEGIEFDGDLDTYTKKLMIVKENYFKNETTSYSSNIEEETFEGEVASTVGVDPVVNRYVAALSRTVKNT